MTSTEIEVREQRVPAVSDALSVEELVGQVRLIQQAMQVAMKNGEHFGVIPGTKKPTLLKPGAEKLCLLFRLDPEYEAIENWDGPHYTVTAKCQLFHIPTGNRVASGMGLCSSREDKYAFRNAKRKCPACGAEAIIKGKEQYGGGWLCWKKSEPVAGCGAKFSDGEPAIEDQEAGKVPNESLPDTYNTVLKMACKRALVAAVLNGTAASDIFTQDLDDSDETLSGAGSPPAESPVVDSRPAGSPAPESVDLSRLNQVLADLGHLDPPEGWKSWVDLAVKWAQDNYGVDSTRAMTQEQVDALAEHLDTFVIPL